VTRRYGCTMFNLLGGMTVALYSEPERPNDSENPVRIVLSAGMPANLWERFARRFGVEIFEFYGTAEGGLTFNRPGTGPIGSVGKPPPVMEVAILDSNSNPVAPGVPGEICFRSTGVPSPQIQYYRNAEASEKKMAGGWLHTGDVGHLDEDGWLFFHHRMGDEIRRNGDFINPGFIEKALAEHPQITDVTVYGIPAASGAPGESDVVAAIVPADPNTLDVASVFAHCRRKLEPSMIPAYLQIVDEIPKTASEKPLHRLLQNSFSAASDNVFRSANANTKVNAMTRKANIIVYGASGYTGQIIMERLAALGLPFVAAGRDRSRLQAAVAKLPASCRGFAEIAAVRHTKEDMTKLFEGAQIVINVTGPFGQIGRPVLEAALAARCHYLDTTGETDWIMTVRDQFGAQFAKAGRIACPALAYMWTAGQLACELALEHGDIDSLDIVYGPGSAPTIASTLSFLRMVTKPQYRLVNNAMDAWPPDARVSVTLPHMHEIMPGLPWGGGAEPIWYAQDPRVRNCRVVVALQSGPMVDWILDCTRRYQEVAHTKSSGELEELTNEWGRAIASTPPREDVAVNRNVISCKARGAFAGREIMLYGSAPYEQTGTLMAEGARQLLAQKVTARGFVSPAAAFGARKLLGALAKAGLQQGVPALLKANGAKVVSRRIVTGHAKRRAPVGEKHMKAAH
jgi:NAD(P)-dependent dehydrogenase (short-subunit alcohol dehydrogenase family)